MYFPLQTAKLEKALKGLCGKFFSDNISAIADREYATVRPNLVNELNKFYKENNIDYQVIMDLGTRIEQLPYNQMIDLTLIEGSRLRPYTLKEGTLTSVDYTRSYGKYNHRYVPLGVVDKDITLPMISDAKGQGWMTPVYFEEVTMRPAVEKAHGHVLKFGLGIGFYPFNILLKDNVEKVTIIEYDLGIIETFKRDLLPQFPRKEDIEIIHGDAFDYLNTEFLNQFDFVFVDIWRNNDDGTVILSNLLAEMELSTALNKDHIQYWIEDSILGNLIEAIAIYLLQDYRGNLENHLTGKISKSNDVEDFITLDKIHAYMQEHYPTTKFKTEKELLALIKDRSFLLSILRSFTVK